MRQSDNLLSHVARPEPSPAPEAGHLRRVAAWCSESARKHPISASDCRILEWAALLHHRTELVVKADAWGMIREELGIEGFAAADAGYAQVVEVLRAFHGDRAPSQRIRQLAMILERSDDLDNACQLDAEFAADPDVNGLEEITAEVASCFSGDAPSMFRIGDVTTRDLPVFPAVASQVFTLLANDQLNFGALESIIQADQSLAGHIIAAANCASAGGLQRVTGIVQALSRIGVIAARRVVRAAALRGMYRTPQSRTLWNHSLDIAEASAHIAQQSGTVDCEAAFLAGLMHDVGKLMFIHLPTETLESHDRLTRAGCPATVVDSILFGTTHAAIGARMLREWRFPGDMISAIEWHHQPERTTSPLCSALYLAEQANDRVGSRDSLPSGWRQEMARYTLGIQGNGETDLAAAHATLSALRFAA